jgi:hypothetical protein
VVKVQLWFDPRATPEEFVASVVIVAVWTVLSSRCVAGQKTAVEVE